LSAKGTSTLLNNALLSAHFRLADYPCGVMSNTVHAFQTAFDLHFAVDRLDQSLDVSITERKRLERKDHPGD